MMVGWVLVMHNFMFRSSAHENINPTGGYRRASPPSSTSDYIIDTFLIW